MAFEVFNKRKQTLGKAPSATLQKRGILSINQSAYDLIGSPESVELLFDADDRVIGLRGVDEDVPHGYGVRRSKSSGPVLVACSAFTQYYGIATDTSRRYVPFERDGILCIDLNTEGVEVVGNRARDSDD